jgi:cytochrome c oxidase subunit 2
MEKLRCRCPVGGARLALLQRQMGATMRRIISASVLGAVFVLGAVVWAAQGGSAEPRKIDITAKKHEFSPARIEVKVGETVELSLNSIDAKHGFECKDLGIKKVTFEKEKPVTLTFTATTPGTFEFKCANFCGFGHGKMKGQIVVSP